MPIGLLSRLQSVPASPLHPGVANCTLKWFTQPLDHFNFGEVRQWRQRYFTYDAYWKPGGPMLFYTGNEASVELYVNATGLMWERAPELGARLVFAEHRYYGKSLPLGEVSTANSSTLRWLTMEQALVDFSRLIYALQTDGKTSAVIAIGGSYGGMLAAWLRMHYPSAVAGAIAASAPVLAFDGLDGLASKWDGSAYWKVVTRDATAQFGGAAPGCVEGVRAFWPAFFARGATAAGRTWLSKAFRLCGTETKAGGESHGQDEDEAEHRRLRQGEELHPLLPRLAAWVLNLWDTLAMGNFPYPSNYLIFQQGGDPAIQLPAWPVRAACRPFAGASSSSASSLSADELIGKMAEAVGVLYNATRDKVCYDLPDDPNYDGIWDYQWCTERLPQETYFALEGGKADMFYRRPRNASAVAEHCRRKYGVGSDRGRTWVAATSSFARRPAPASNIIFSNGEFDPWRSGGVLSDLSPSLRAIEVDKGAHHLDLFFSNPADPPSVRAAREIEVAAIRAWVAQAGEHVHVEHSSAFASTSA